MVTKSAILLACFLGSTKALAGSEIHSFATENYGQSYAAKALGSVCHVLDPFKAMIPCNPASLAIPQSNHFGMQINLGNNISQLGYVEDILDGRIEFELQEDLFEKRKPLYGEAHSEIQFRSTKWAFGVVPYHIRLYSQFENYALPQVELLALKERSVRYQMATYVQYDFHFGVQFRAVQRELLVSEFGLFDAIADSPELKGSDQAAFYVEPGLLYQRERDPWGVRLSAMLTEVGYLSKKYEGFDGRPFLQLGAGIAPVFEYGTLSLGVNYKGNHRSQDWKQGLEFATAYQLGIAVVSVMVAHEQYTLGLLARHFDLEGGVIFVDQNLGADSFGQAVIDRSVQAHLAVRF